jgi:hypothetical protein
MPTKFLILEPAAIAAYLGSHKRGGDTVMETDSEEDWWRFDDLKPVARTTTRQVFEISLIELQRFNAHFLVAAVTTWALLLI